VCYRCPQIEEDRAPAVHPDVCRLQVAVDEASIVKRGECRGHCRHELPQARNQDARRPVLLEEPPPCIGSVDEVLHEKGSSGEFVASHTREIPYAMYPWPGTIALDGQILDIGVRFTPPYDHVLMSVDPATAAADTFPLPSYDGGQFVFLNDAGQPSRSVTIPFAGQLVWTLDPRGYIWSGITDQYRIVQRRLTGDTVMVVERDQRPVPVTAEDRAAAIEGLEPLIAEVGRVDYSRIPTTKPVISTFIVDDRGYLWVRPQGEALEDVAYDVFDPEGRYLGPVPSPVRLSMWTARPVFRGEHMYGFTTDEFDVPYLIRLRIEGREEG
jgi:hypothetical protein